MYCANYHCIITAHISYSSAAADAADDDGDDEAAVGCGLALVALGCWDALGPLLLLMLILQCSIREMFVSTLRNLLISGTITEPPQTLSFPP